MTAKERRSLLKDLRKFGVTEYEAGPNGLVRVVFAPEGPAQPGKNPSPKERDTAAHGAGGALAPERQRDLTNNQTENPYQELASAVGLDWARISGQHAGETD